MRCGRGWAPPDELRWYGAVDDGCRRLHLGDGGEQHDPAREGEQCAGGGVAAGRCKLYAYLLSASLTAVAGSL